MACGWQVESSGRRKVSVGGSNGGVAAAQHRSECVCEREVRVLLVECAGLRLWSMMRCCGAQRAITEDVGDSGQAISAGAQVECECSTGEWVAAGAAFEYQPGWEGAGGDGDDGQPGWTSRH